MSKYKHVGKAAPQDPQGHPAPEAGSAHLVLGVQPRPHSYQLHAEGSTWRTIRLLSPFDSGNAGV